MLADIKTALRPALVLTILFALLLGIAYPLALTGVGNLVSLVSDIATRGEKSTPGHQRRRASEDE